MPDQPQAFADARVLMFFPTCVWLHDLKPEDAAAINAKIVPKINQLLEPREETIKAGIWQTHHDLHKLEEFRRLVAFIRTAAAGALDFVQVDYTDFAVTGCWANVNPPGTGHRPHMHPNNFLSGVYYAQTPQQSDGLIFHDPRPQAFVVSPKVKKLTELTGSEMKLDVREGRLVVFPAWLEHSVAPTEGEGERVSVSFNIMLANFTEEFSPPKWSRRPSV
ncbi:MAG: 2OG-Fe(II) oxygenase family protein [Kiloniellaceae bacterium]